MPDIDNSKFDDSAHGSAASEKLSPFKEKLALIIVLGTIILMLFENVIGIKMYLIACIGAVLLVLTGVLSEKGSTEFDSSADNLPVCGRTVSFRCDQSDRSR